MGYVCLVTPEGTGAIAVVEVLGNGIHTLAGRQFTGRIERPLKSYHGHITDDAGLVDEVLVRWIPPESSFTGLETVQISCHGNPYVAKRITKCFTSKGLKELSQTEYLDLALDNKKIDRIQQEAYLCIQTAFTRKAALVLNDQIQGCLSRAIRESSDLKPLLKTAHFGRALTSPLQITFIGAPNVGKSSLFNRLLEHERALVYPERGTTRDPVREYLSIKGIPFLLCDTAGVGKPQDKLEEMSIERTMRQIEKADLIIHVFDGTRPLNQDERKLVDLTASFKVVRLLNKTDIGSSDLSVDLHTSAVTGDGISSLRQYILDKLSLDVSYEPDSPIVFTRRQVDIINRHPLEEAKTLLLGE